MISTLLAAAATAALLWAAMAVSVWFWIPLGLVLVVYGWVLWFFRDPQRTPPEGDGLFVSPADGVVSDVTPLGPDSPLGCDGLRIGIFMNVFNVHVNRAPCDGEVKAVTHNPGAFLDARNPDASERNESASIYLSHKRNGREYTIIVRQVAGLIARRIVTKVSPGDALQRGERFGMIKWGSRLEVLLPKELQGEVCVKPGQRTVAGETVIFRVQEEK